MKKQIGIASVAAIGILAGAVASPANARDHRDYSNNGGVRHSSTSYVYPTALTAEQQVALDAFNASVTQAKLIRKTATNSARATYLVAKATAKANKVAALSLAATDAERKVVKTAYRAEVRQAHDARKAADYAARTVFKASVASAAEAFTAATGLTAPSLHNRD